MAVTRVQCLLWDRWERLRNVRHACDAKTTGAARLADVAPLRRQGSNLEVQAAAPPRGAHRRAAGQVVNTCCRAVSLHARGGKGINESFTVRKISYGEGVERVFPVFSPLVEEIEVKRKGKVRRAKLYYLRELRGKSARIVERTTGRGIEATRKKGEAKKKK